MDLERLIQKVNNGRQLGYSFSEVLDNDMRYKSVAIQRDGSEFVVYSHIGLESQMAMDLFLKEAIVRFQYLKDALDFIEKDEGVALDLLAPCKGQRIFKP